MRNILTAIVIIAALTMPALAQTDQERAREKMREDLQRELLFVQQCYSTTNYDDYALCARRVQLLRDALALLGSH